MRVIYLLTINLQTVNYHSTIYALELIYFDSNTIKRKTPNGIMDWFFKKVNKKRQISDNARRPTAHPPGQRYLKERIFEKPVQKAKKTHLLLADSP